MQRRRIAVKLPSSGEVLFYPNGDDINEDTLSRLLWEAREAGIPFTRRVIATAKIRDPSLEEWGYDEAYIQVREPIPLSRLHRMWKSLPSALKYDEFTQANESERTHFMAEAYKISGSFPAMMGLLMRVLCHQTTGKTMEELSGKSPKPSPANTNYLWQQQMSGRLNAQED